MGQTIAEALIEEGIEKGQLLASRDTLKRLLSQRFGALPEPLVQRIEGVFDLSRLNDALDQVLRINSLDELKL
jgi:hypothetical protein